jgi:hypothetical protein
MTDAVWRVFEGHSGDLVIGQPDEGFPSASAAHSWAKKNRISVPYSIWRD